MVVRIVNIGTLDIRINVTNAAATRALKKTSQGMSQVTKDVVRAESQLKKYYELQSRGIKISQTSQSHMNGLKKTYADAGGNLKALKENAAGMNDQWGRTGAIGKMNAALNSVRWTMVNVGFAMAAVGVPLTILIKSYQEFETISHKIAAVTGENAKVIGEDLLNASKNTIFSIKEVGDAFLEINKAGYDAADAMLIVTEAQKLAIAGFASLETSTDVLVKTLHAYNMNGAEVATLTDIIGKAANDSSADVETFAQALSFSAGTAYQMQVPLRELAGLLGILQDQGIAAGKAGRNLNRAMLSLINPSAQASEVLDYLGVETIDSVTGNTRNFIDIAEDLTGSLTNVSNKAEVLSKIFTTQGLRAFMALSNASEASGRSIRDLSLEFVDAEDLSKSLAEQMVSDANRIQRSWQNMVKGMQDSGLSAFFSETTALAIQGLDYFMRQFAAIFSSKTHKEVFEEMIDENKRLSMATRDVLALDIALAKEAGNTAKAQQLQKELDILETRNDLEVMALTAYKRGDAERYNLINRVIAKTEELTTWNKSLIEAKKRGDIEAAQLAQKNIDIIWERIDATGEYLDIQKQLVKEQNNTDFSNFMKSFVGFSFTDVQKDIFNVQETVKSLTEELQELIDKEIISRTQFNEYAKAIRDVALAQHYVLIETENLNDKISIWDDRVDYINDKLEEEKAILSELNDELSIHKEELSALLNMRFAGQTDAEEAIYGVEMAIKREKLRLLELGETSEDVGDSLSTMNDEYSAWVDTIKTFITEAVNAGSDLGKNVTGIVRTFQTKLLGLSMSEDITSGSEESSTAMTALQTELEKLQLQYDLSYGDMRHQVELAKTLHEEEANGVAQNANDVVTALQSKWIAIDKVTQQIETQNSVVDAWTSQLDIAKDHIADLKDEIEKLQDVLKSTKENVNSGKSSKSIGSRGLTASLRSGESFVEMEKGVYADPFAAQVLRDIGEYAIGGKVRNDGLAYVHSGEVITPAKVNTPYNNSMSSGVNVGSINVTVGGGTNSQALGRQIAQTIKSELSRIS